MTASTPNATTRPLSEVGASRQRLAFAARRPVLTGLALGFTWGVLMRVWMRYISTSHEFSWSGTLFIVGATTIVGIILGVAHRRRRAGGAGWWRLSLAALVLLGAGGGVMWPAVILGGIAIARRRPAWLAPMTGLLAVATQVPIVNDFAIGNWQFGLLDKVAATAWYAVMLGFEAWAFSVVFAPNADDVPVPRRVKVTLASAGVALVLLIAVFAVGLGM